MEGVQVVDEDSLHSFARLLAAFDLFFRHLSLSLFFLSWFQRNQYSQSGEQIDSKTWDFTCARVLFTQEGRNARALDTLDVHTFIYTNTLM